MDTKQKTGKPVQEIVDVYCSWGFLLFVKGPLQIDSSFGNRLFVCLLFMGFSIVCKRTFAN